MSVRSCVPTFSATIYAQRDNETAIPTGSSLHWLHFLKGDFRITTASRREKQVRMPKTQEVAQTIARIALSSAILIIPH